ncbi:hypothetical protein [Microbulbifer sp. VAAF005]|uniref:hypothetical protein n=1 Tax=Microbulbifer sp. VAAF005 TaxID=3034230 RepID=UPI0024ACDC11|nr:hypothetical protein [Microbulbifer sp. VAAF005]WHI46616.1 hypothetical protein P0078_23400 [Microbulbifer sp. VAAF005]
MLIDIAVGEFSVIGIDSVFTVSKVSATGLDTGGPLLGWLVPVHLAKMQALSAISNIAGAVTFVAENTGSSVNSFAVIYWHTRLH